MLIDHGADIVFREKEKRDFSPLFYAIKKDNPYIVELFCDAKVNLDITNSKGETPLMFAAYNGYNETVNHLTLRAKSLDIEDKQGMTLLLIYI